MKKVKLKLEDLQVKSFVTSTSSKDKITIAGGGDLDPCWSYEKGNCIYSDVAAGCTDKTCERDSERDLCFCTEPECQIITEGGAVCPDWW